MVMTDLEKDFLIIRDGILSTIQESHEKLLIKYPYFARVEVFNEDDGAFKWCEKQFEIWSWPGNNRWCSSVQGYYFKNEKDFILFTLRWS